MSCSEGRASFRAGRPELVYRARETVRSNEKGFLRRDASSVRAADTFHRMGTEQRRCVGRGPELRAGGL